VLKLNPEAHQFEIFSSDRVLSQKTCGLRFFQKGFIVSKVGLLKPYASNFSSYKSKYALYSMGNMNMKARTDEELGDFALSLSQYDFEVICYPGKDNCSSRNPLLKPEENEKTPLRIVNQTRIEDIQDQ
ncbi:hypothetical protein HHI36_002223, partial [Cryptolaemus montrouzieri]